MLNRISRAKLEYVKHPENYQSRFHLPDHQDIYVYIYIVLFGPVKPESGVYQATIYPKENITDQKTYIGLTSTEWKARYSNHKFTCSHEHLKHHTALSKQFWCLKKQRVNP